MVSNMCPIQPGELSGSLPIGFNSNCTTLAEGKEENSAISPISGLVRMQYSVLNTRKVKGLSQLAQVKQSFTSSTVACETWLC